VDGISGVESRVAGAYYRGDAIMEMVNRMKKGTALLVKPEPNNRYDKNAQAIYAYSKTRYELVHIGYVEKATAYQIAVARDKHCLTANTVLSAKANGFAGITIEGAIAIDKYNKYVDSYMK
jgi:hypothetical protein